LGPILTADDPKQQQRAMPGQARGIEVQAFDLVAQRFVTVGVREPREHEAIAGIDLGEEAQRYVSDKGAVRVRLVWHAKHRLDFAGIGVLSDAPHRVRSVMVDGANMEGSTRDVVAALLSADGRSVEIGINETLALSFRDPVGVDPMVGTEGPGDVKQIRSYVLRLEGHYVTLPLSSGPVEAKLVGASPNPFNPTTTIGFTISDASHVEMRIFAADGREIARLIDDGIEAGSHSVRWDGRDARGADVASGVYFVRLDVQGQRTTQRLILLR